jgi:hypothetical protein
MKWIIEYCLCPTNHNRTRYAIIQAKDAETARKLLKRELRDFGTISPYAFEAAKEYKPEPLEGRVDTLG